MSEKKLTPSELRSFRSTVSKLKSQGLISPITKSGNKLDARSATPNWRDSSGRKLSTIVAKYDDVVSGKLTAVKVTPTKLKEYKRAGFETTKDRVLVPHSAGEKVSIKNDKIKVTSKSGVQIVHIPVEYHDLEQYLKDVMKKRHAINRMKQPDEWFGFSYFGNHSIELFDSIEQVVRRLRSYGTIQNLSRYKQKEIYKNLVIVKMPDKGSEKWFERPPRQRSKEYNRKRAKIFREKLADKPEFIQERYREQARVRQARRRSKLKKKPAIWKSIIAKESARAAKSRKELEQAVKKQLAASAKQTKQAVKKTKQAIAKQTRHEKLIASKAAAITKQNQKQIDDIQKQIAKLQKQLAKLQQS